MKKNDPEVTIGLLPWADVWEDFYSTMNMSFDTFCNELTGGWQFGYIEALKLAGIRTVLIYTSARVNEISRYTHKPTDTTIYMLPVPKSYLAVRKHMIHPYPSLAYWNTFEDLFGNVRGARRALFRVLRYVAPYWTTPLRKVAKVLKRENCKAIFCQEYEYYRFDLCILLGRLMGLPVFANYQGGSMDCNRLGRFLRPFTIKRSAGLVIGARKEVERVHNSYGIEVSRLAKIFNPVDLSMWEPLERSEARARFGIPAESQVVVWHGRIDMLCKGLDIMMDAWEQICRERPGRDLRLCLMGIGEDAEKFRKRIASSQLQNVMWIDRYITDRDLMRHFLYAGDVYAFPSRYEGFPVSPIEAMACGLPLVAADAPGIPDILENGEESGGLRVPVDDMKTFTLALGRLLDDQPFARELGRRARIRVEQEFSLQAIGKQLADFLLESIQK